MPRRVDWDLESPNLGTDPHLKIGKLKGIASYTPLAGLQEGIASYTRHHALRSLAMASYNVSLSLRSIAIDSFDF